MPFQEDHWGADEESWGDGGGDAKVLQAWGGQPSQLRRTGVYTVYLSLFIMSIINSVSDPDPGFFYHPDPNHQKIHIKNFVREGLFC